MGLVNRPFHHRSQQYSTLPMRLSTHCFYWPVTTSREDFGYQINVIAYLLRKLWSFNPDKDSDAWRAELKKRQSKKAYTGYTDIRMLTKDEIQTVIQARSRPSSSMEQEARNTSVSVSLEKLPTSVLEKVQPPPPADSYSTKPADRKGKKSKGKKDSSTDSSAPASLVKAAQTVATPVEPADGTGQLTIPPPEPTVFDTADEIINSLLPGHLAPKEDSGSEAARRSEEIRRQMKVFEELRQQGEQQKQPEQPVQGTLDPSEGYRIDYSVDPRNVRMPSEDYPQEEYTGGVYETDTDTNLTAYVREAFSSTETLHPGSSDHQTRPQTYQGPVVPAQPRPLDKIRKWDLPDPSVVANIIPDGFMGTTEECLQCVDMNKLGEVMTQMIQAFTRHHRPMNEELASLVTDRNTLLNQRAALQTDNERMHEHNKKLKSMLEKATKENLMKAKTDAE